MLQGYANNYDYMPILNILPNILVNNCFLLGFSQIVNSCNFNVPRGRKYTNLSIKRFELMGNIVQWHNFFMSPLSHDISKIYKFIPI